MRGRESELGPSMAGVPERDPNVTPGFQEAQTGSGGVTQGENVTEQAPPTQILETLCSETSIKEICQQGPGQPVSSCSGRPLPSGPFVAPPCLSRHPEPTDALSIALNIPLSVSDSIPPAGPRSIIILSGIRAPSGPGRSSSTQTSQQHLARARLLPATPPGGLTPSPRQRCHGINWKGS